ncbi:FAD/NAD(P)-binding domain-containing protein [Nemania abortiva]|nr:FAD/NAD(P)-binding domain-containing protein [Nemania abortiva]
MTLLGAYERSDNAELPTCSTLGLPPIAGNSVKFQQVEPLTAGVVGAGIAGLSAAIALRRAGFEVEVYERSRFGNEIGAAISAPPNATVVLMRWGFDFAAANIVPNCSTRYAAAGDLGVVFENNYDDVDKVLMGTSSLSFHRVDLHRGLRALATGDAEIEGDDEEGDSEESDRDDEEWHRTGKGRRRGRHIGTPVVIRLGCGITSVDCENGVLTLADGSQVQKDLVIIADGAHSSLLADFLGHPPATQPTGRSIYRWLVSMDEVMADPELAEQFRSKPPGFLGWFDAEKRVHWVNYTCRGGSVLNNAVVHDSEEHPLSSSQSNDNSGDQADYDSIQSGRANDGRDSEEEGNILWHAPAAKETVLETLSNFHPAVRRIVSMASEDGIRVHRLYKRPPLESFVRGRTAVIGDAAHVMMPTHAAGCSVAIESASVIEVLFRGLKGYPNSSATGYGRENVIAERLQLFDKLRIPRCNLTMLASNAGPDWLRVPGVEQEIRRFYRGALPPKDALPWSDEFRLVLFYYDGYEVAKQALKDEKERRNGGIHGQQ